MILLLTLHCKAKIGNNLIRHLSFVHDNPNNKVMTLNKTMKFTKLLSVSFCFLLASVAVSSLSSCGSDEPKSPDDFNTAINPSAMISPSVIPGKWKIENIVDAATGKSIDINQEISVGDFKVQQKSDDISVKYDHQFWTETYDKIIAYGDAGSNDSTYVSIGFCKAVTADVKNSLITDIRFAYPLSTSAGTLTNIFYLTDFDYSDGVLTSKNSAYISTELSGVNVHQVAGVMRLRKIRDTQTD